MGRKRKIAEEKNMKRKSKWKYFKKIAEKDNGKKKILQKTKSKKIASRKEEKKDNDNDKDLNDHVLRSFIFSTTFFYKYRLDLIHDCLSISNIKIFYI